MRRVGRAGPLRRRDVGGADPRRRSQGIELDDATIGAVVAALGGAPRPVTLDKARIERQIRELALEHAAGRLEDAVYLERLHELREAKDDAERTTGERVCRGAGDRVAPRIVSDLDRGRRPRGEGGRAPRHLRPDCRRREEDRVGEAHFVGLCPRTGACAARPRLLWRARQDSNLRPSAPEADALSTELQAREPRSYRSSVGRASASCFTLYQRALSSSVSPPDVP